MKRKLTWCGCEQLAAHSAWNMDSLLLHVRAGLLPQLYGFWVSTELNSDLFQNGLGIPLDDFDRFRTQKLNFRKFASNEW